MDEIIKVNFSPFLPSWFGIDSIVIELIEHCLDVHDHTISNDVHASEYEEIIIIRLVI